MIEVYEGRIGGGKTYNAVERAMLYLSRGGCVCTNINLQIEEVRTYLLKRYKWVLQEGQIIIIDEGVLDYEHPGGKHERIKKITVFHKFTPAGTKERPVLVIIDEAHFHFPNASYGRIPKETIEFLTMSRHHCTDVIFISQHIKNMSGQMQRLCEFVWRFRDMQRFGFPIKILMCEINCPWPFPTIRYNKEDYAGNYIEGGFKKKETAIFDCYASPELINGFDRTKEKTDFRSESKIEKGISMKEKFMWVGLGLCLGCAVMAMLPTAEAVPVSQAVVCIESELPLARKVDLELLEPDSEPEKIFAHGYCEIGNQRELYIEDKIYRIGDKYNGLKIGRIDAENIWLADGDKLIPYEFELKALKRDRDEVRFLNKNKQHREYERF